MSLKNKVAIVTGATRGLGRAILEEICAQDGKVFFTYLNNIEIAKNICDEMGENVACMQADASDHEAAQDVVSEAIKTFGGIDILVNNSGVAKHKALEDITFEDFDYSIRNTLNPVFNYIKAVIPHFIAQKSGKIVNIGSVNGLHGREGSSPYCAAKAGIIGFSKATAKEMGKYHINCNVVAPGFINTDGQRNTSELVKKLVLSECYIKELTTPEQVAKLVAFLSSDSANAITGQVYQMDCGQYI